MTSGKLTKVPQEPQFLGSLRMSTHVVPHNVLAGGRHLIGLPGFKQAIIFN